MKKELYIPIIIIALTIIFGAICLMVFLSNGNAYWIKKKLKIGALLLTFSWFANSCDKTIETCYAPVMSENSIWVDNRGDSLTYSLSDTMFLQIHNPTYNFFSFDIINNKEVSIKSGFLQKQDDTIKFNPFYFLIFSDSIESGKYKINFFGETDSLITKKNKIISYDFNIN